MFWAMTLLHMSQLTKSPRGSPCSWIFPHLSVHPFPLPHTLHLDTGCHRRQVSCGCPLLKAQPALLTLGPLENNYPGFVWPLAPCAAPP